MIVGNRAPTNWSCSSPASPVRSATACIAGHISGLTCPRLYSVRMPWSHRRTPR